MQRDSSESSYPDKPSASAAAVPRKRISREAGPRVLSIEPSPHGANFPRTGTRANRVETCRNACSAPAALAQEEHRDSRSNAGNTGEARDPPPPRRQLLEQNEQRQQRDPEHVHDAEDEQERHQNPAASYAVGSVPKPEVQTTAHVAAKPTVLHQKPERRLALGKTGVLDWRPLIEAGRNQNEGAEQVAGACHAGVQQRLSLQHPLDERRCQREANPREEIARGKPACRR